MPENAPMSTGSGSKPMMFGVIGLIVGLVAGGFAGMTYAKKTSFEAGKQVGLEEARKVVEDSGLLRGTGNDQEVLNDISGKVTSVSGNEIVIDARQTEQNPLARQAPIVRRVRVTDTTNITLRTERSEEDFQAAMTAYDKAAIAARNSGVEDAEMNVERPDRYATTVVKIGDVKPGMPIAVSSETDIRFAEQIDATNVMLRAITEDEATLDAASAPEPEPTP